ncbi:MAG: hypothetical protein HYT82_01285 [Candidatus Harrisonbacteria bacterium]|nr:hypothetical protein [Candidatus Harrisonbacteria bacterium]
MKGCLLLQRRFATISHAIALTLKEKYGISEFCGYVCVRSSFDFLKSQKDIRYGTLLLDDELQKDYVKEKLDPEYLHYLEKTYGIPNLWPYIACDRVVMFKQLLREYPYNTPMYAHEEMLRILQVKARAIIKMLEEEKPDFVFASVVGSMGGMLLYHIAKKKNIRVIIADVARIGELLTVSDHFAYHTWTEQMFQELQRKERTSARECDARTFLENFRKNPTPYFGKLYEKDMLVDRRRQLQFLKPAHILRSLGWVLRLTLGYVKNPHRDDYEEIKPWHYLIDRIKSKARILRGFNDLYSKPAPNEDYAFFPLHFEPEIATMLYAPFFTDQLYVIRQIARSLPVTYKLYVKDHPGMIGFRPRSYYKELKKIPNVRLINPIIKSFPLIQNAKIVTTISSSVGWEAVLLKKPVITFGDVFYNALSTVKHCRTIDELPYLIKEQLESTRDNEQELVNYIAATMEVSVEVPLLRLWEREIGDFAKVKKGMEPAADLIARKLGITAV